MSLGSFCHLFPCYYSILSLLFEGIGLWNNSIFLEYCFLAFSCVVQKYPGRMLNLTTTQGYIDQPHFRTNFVLVPSQNMNKITQECFKFGFWINISVKEVNDHFKYTVIFAVNQFWWGFSLFDFRLLFLRCTGA